MLVLFLDSLPFILFTLLNRFRDLKAAVIGAIIGGAIAVIYNAILYHRVEYFLLISFFILIGCSLLSFRQKNEIFFKLQPAIVGSLFGCFMLVGYYGFHYSFVLEMMTNTQEALQQAPLPISDAVLFELSKNLGFGLLILACFIAFAALKLSNWWWMSIRVIGLPVVCGISLAFSLS